MGGWLCVLQLPAVRASCLTQVYHMGRIWVAETRGPYTRPFTVYFVHTKTAFSVKGVCKRFSEFKELDGRIRAKFPYPAFTATFPPDQIFNSMLPEFVSERRKLLQKYLDEAMAVPSIARFKDLHEFLGIPGDGLDGWMGGKLGSQVESQLGRRVCVERILWRSCSLRG